MSNTKNETGTGAIVGFQLPLGLKKREKSLKELLSKSGVDEQSFLGYYKSLDDKDLEKCHSKIDNNDQSLSADVKNHGVRLLVKKKIGEIVRKSADGGYVLYVPNKGKKGKAKAAARFPTKLGAKRAELTRFPPKDPGKKDRLRKEVEKMAKKKQKGSKKTPAQPEKNLAKKESIDRIVMLAGMVRSIVTEGLFREESVGSVWDEKISRLSDKIVASDKKFKSLQDNIEKSTVAALEEAFKIISKAVDRKVVKVKSLGIKKSLEKGVSYLAFSAIFETSTVSPIFIYLEKGVPKIEFSEEARSSLTKVDASESKLFRADLVQAQERQLDKLDILRKSIELRDRYLDKVENEVDEFVADLSPLQLGILKTLVSKKYKK